MSTHRTGSKTASTGKRNLIAREQKQIQKIAKYLYLASPFSKTLVAKALKVTPQTLRNWARKNQWEKTAQQNTSDTVLKHHVKGTAREYLIEHLWEVIEKTLEQLAHERDFETQGVKSTDIRTLNSLISALDKLSSLDEKFKQTQTTNESTAEKDLEILREELTTRLQSLENTRRKD